MPASIVKDPSVLAGGEPWYNGDTEIRTCLEEGERLTMKVRDAHRQLGIHRVETEPEFLHVEVAFAVAGR